jgi:hypothetical protein
VAGSAGYSLQRGLAACGFAARDDIAAGEGFAVRDAFAVGVAFADRGDGA